MDKQHKKTFCFVAGKSGGHLLPALTHARQLLQNREASHILFFSTNTDLDRHIMSDYTGFFTHIPLPLPNVPYSKPWRYPLFLLQFLYSIAIGLFYLHKKKPARVIAMGGIISVPIGIAGNIMRIPLELHELNAVPGLAVRCLAPLASKITVCFKQAMNRLPAQKCIVTPYPVRFKPYNIQNKKAAPHKTVFIIGGSQGSLFLNRVIRTWIEETPHAHGNLAIIHQTGSTDTFDWQSFYKKYRISARVFSYANAIDRYYQQADLIISRAGAGVLFEIAFFRRKCIIIPLETKSTGHQKDNAIAMAQNYPHLFTVITQQEVQHNTEQVCIAITNHVYGTNTGPLIP